MDRSALSCRSNTTWTCATTCQSSSCSSSSVVDEPRRQRIDGHRGGCDQGNSTPSPPLPGAERGVWQGGSKKSCDGPMTKATKGNGGRARGGGRAPLTPSTEETKSFWGGGRTAPHQSPLRPQGSGAAWRSRKCLQLQWLEGEVKKIEGGGRSSA